MTKTQKTVPIKGTGGDKPPRPNGQAAKKMVNGPAPTEVDPEDDQFNAEAESMREELNNSLNEHVQRLRQSRETKNLSMMNTITKLRTSAVSLQREVNRLNEVVQTRDQSLKTALNECKLAATTAESLRTENRRLLDAQDVQSSLNFKRTCAMELRHLRSAQAEQILAMEHRLMEADHTYGNLPVIDRNPVRVIDRNPIRVIDVEQEAADQVIIQSDSRCLTN